MILGTVGHTSPEQARGKPVDRRADILTIPGVELAKDGTTCLSSHHEIRSQLFLVKGMG